MEFKVSDIRDALTLLKPVVPRKSTLPVLQNVLLDNGKAMASDLETGVILAMPEFEGKCLLPHREASELLKYIPGSKTITIEQERSRVNLSWDGDRASYVVAEPRDYPPVPRHKADLTGPHLDGDALIKALMAVLPYCAREETRPIFTGVTLHLGEEIGVFAADGYRLAYQALAESCPTQETVIIPASTVRALDYLWKKAPATPDTGHNLVFQILAKRKLEMVFSQGQIHIHFGSVTLVFKPIEGLPPDYKQLIPGETSIKLYIFAPELEVAVRRVMGIAKDSSNSVRLTWSEAELAVSAKSEEKGTVETRIPVRVEGEAGQFALNGNYLLQYLKGKEGVVTIGIQDKIKPALFHHDSSPLVLIMPMFVQWGDEKPTAAEKEPEPDTIEENPEVEPEEELESSLEEEATEAEEPEPAAAAPTETPAKRKRKR